MVRKHALHIGRMIVDTRLCRIRNIGFGHMEKPLAEGGCPAPPHCISGNGAHSNSFRTVHQTKALEVLPRQAQKATACCAKPQVSLTILENASSIISPPTGSVACGCLPT